MRLTDVYKRLLNLIDPVLKEYGYSRKGNTYYIELNGNWGLINFQKSQKSNSSCVIFTINIGVSLKDLVKFFTPEKAIEKPTIEDCHWRQRIGLLFENRQDKWWSVTEQTLVDELARELNEHLRNTVIPEIERHISNEKLLKLWQSGQSIGLTETQRLINLSVLLKLSGSNDQLELIIQNLKNISDGKPTAHMVKQHLNDLRGVM
ncbi:DUF4304 domain-containing protein [Methylicorpusculum sp.]|uniref:DUF4304 domain-containing protein n=1 Tax=Methylicorpusculum sp. TaxID=2713644 RepID=UPI00274DE6DD|nr:DUF4304 domain-containing protein [Methylicorpusculum sp.]MDP2174127.1 DUF4304 domain-containing protein [Candidatus Cloacimonadaceae bacterium]MDZ4149544.1 DUF4304 domain-containing protein [Methylicorpusculum sp.]